MKKLSVLVTSIVLGVSGVAAAAPSTTVYPSHAAQFRPAVRPAPLAYQRWTVLDTAQLRSGRDVINIRSAQRFSKLKLEAKSGIASVDKVLVTYGNGRTQVIEVDQRLGLRGKQSTVIDLNGRERQIKSIVIYGKSGRFMRGGALTISAA